MTTAMTMNNSANNGAINNIHHDFKGTMRRQALLLSLAPLFFCAAHAQTVAPGAGTLLQQTQPVKPPTAAPADTGLVIENQQGGKLPPSAPFTVTAIQIEGNTRFDNATLHALVADAEGQSLTLAQLGDTVNRITAYYRERGYPLARAIIPAQTIRAGVVQVQVIEARYGKITLDNRSRINDMLLETTLATLHPGQPIEQGSLDRSLLLLSDIPGAAVSGNLKPGQEVGTSDLAVEVTTPRTVSATASIDDYGNRYTGRERIGADINVFGPLQHGDVLSANVLSSGSGMDYGRFAYDILLNGLGTQAGAAFSALHYQLGDNLSALDDHGTAQDVSLWFKHPFVRNREFNLFGQLQIDHKQLNDEIGASDIHDQRHIDNWNATLSGDLHDTLLGDAIDSWNLGWENGRVGFDDGQAQAADAVTVRSAGGFSKWTANATRLQSIDRDNSLYLLISTQWSNTNLDASEKMVAGGPYSVRAYDMGALSGDSGALGSVEFRHELGGLWGGQAQAVAFFDSEHVTINHTTWTADPNSANLSGAGIGLNWFGPEQWSAKGTLAAPLGATPVQLGSDSKSVRAWVEVDKGF